MASRDDAHATPGELPNPRHGAQDPAGATAGRDRLHGLRMQQLARKFDAELSFEA
jgi:hypothetical protein